MKMFEVEAYTDDSEDKGRYIYMYIHTDDCIKAWNNLFMNKML